MAIPTVARHGVRSLPSAAARRRDADEPGRVDVLHVVEAFGGGVETALKSYIDATPWLRHQLLGRQRNGHATGVFGDNVDVRLVDGGLRSLARALRETVREVRPRVIHAHSSFAGVLARALPLRGPGIVYSPHCYATERLDVPWTHRSAYTVIERTLGLRSQVVAALSPHEASLAHVLSPRADVVIVPNVATAPRSLTLRTGTGSTEIVVVGRIMAQKDPHFLAEVIRQAALGDRISCTWVGDGDPGLRQELESVGVHVTGWVSHDVVASHIAHADLYVSTAAWEGSPMTLLEAARLGVPVIARDIPSLRSLGYYVAGSTPAEVAAHVSSFVDDVAAQARVLRQTQDVAANHTRERLAAALLSCYELADPSSGNEPVIDLTELDRAV